MNREFVDEVDFFERRNEVRYASLCLPAAIWAVPHYTRHNATTYACIPHKKQVQDALDHIHLHDGDEGATNYLDDHDIFDEELSEHELSESDFHIPAATAQRGMGDGEAVSSYAAEQGLEELARYLVYLIATNIPNSPDAAEGSATPQPAPAMTSNESWLRTTPAARRREACN